ncbi:odorant receptor 67c isoform X2 [Diachasma alloeum]|uniref:odorant receptor 67c isoform X2 n=1 Tax=Diachasma alloeum TaxID=454923 RepID=UPI0010FB4331|nr:odorant receptor 67c isoform X2 [Diachasma alloeum]
MDIFTTGYYKRNRIFMITVGIWPESSKFSKNFARTLVLIISFSMLLPQYAFLKQPGRDMSDFVSVLIIETVIILVSIELCYVAWNMKKVEMEINRMREDWLILRETPAFGIIHRYALRGALGTTLYMVFVFSASTLIFFLLPLEPIILDIVIPLNESRSKIYAFDSDYSIYGISTDDHYYFTLIHSLAIGLILADAIVSIDTFVLIAVEHCCGLFEAVGYLLQEMHEEHSPWCQNQIIRKAIFVHKRAISLAEHIESSFTMMFGFVVLINMILISITALQAMLEINELAKMARFLVFTVGQITHLLFLSIPGQELYDHSSRVFRTIYDSHWFEMSTQHQKIVHIMLMRSMKPSLMTAGKFYHMNVENFKNILQASMSYFTVFLSAR